MKILIIEDEYNLADAIKSVLSKEKYDSEICVDGNDGYNEALTDIYDLILLDVMLPHMNGFEILRELKKEKISSKIIMLTAKSNIEDKMNGFNNGADDYLTKPFHMDELLARVNLQLRKNDNKNILTIGDIELDIPTLCLKNVNNLEVINIIGKEFNILEMFIKNPNQIIDKEQIFNKIWGYESNSELNTLEAYISFLRKKLKSIDSIVTIKAVRNMGYRLELKDEKIKD